LPLEIKTALSNTTKKERGTGRLGNLKSMDYREIGGKGEPSEGARISENQKGMSIQKRSQTTTGDRGILFQKEGDHSRRILRLASGAPK